MKDGKILNKEQELMLQIQMQLDSFRNWIHYNRLNPIVGMSMIEEKVKDMKNHWSKKLRKSIKKNKKKKITCQWCHGTTTPFHKLNVHMYGNHRFICEKCYNELEEQQRLYDSYFEGE